MTRFRLEDSRAVANCIGWFAKAIQYVGEISRIRPTSTEDDGYFGEYLQAQKEALSAKGSELGLAVTLFSLIVSTRAERAIEIGRFQGFSTLALASGLRFNDWGWSEPQEHFQRKDGVSPEEFHRPKTRRLYSIDSGPKIHAYELIKRNNLSRYVEFVNGDSREVNLDVAADVLFIDGDHSYEGCRGDVDRFVPKNLRPGGYFILHDYFGYFDQEGGNRSPVKTVCDELVAEGVYEHILIDTHCMSFMVFRKP